ncbi:MAG: GNAT family N-acetyltransferase [Elusimicrobia bacterium]|nr:GNAT family N-acetyltransferase [Elusimicrobiota bacterium]
MKLAAAFLILAAFEASALPKQTGRRGGDPSSPRLSPIRRVAPRPLAAGVERPGLFDSTHQFTLLQPNERPGIGARLEQTVFEFPHLEAGDGEQAAASGRFFDAPGPSREAAVDAKGIDSSGNYSVRLTRLEGGAWIAKNQSWGRKTHFQVKSLSELPEYLLPQIPQGTLEQASRGEVNVSALVSGGRIAGHYVFNPSLQKLEWIAVARPFRGSGAVDVLLEELVSRELGGNRQASFRASIERKHTRAMSGPFLGTVEEFKWREGILSQTLSRFRQGAEWVKARVGSRPSPKTPDPYPISLVRRSQDHWLARSGREDGWRNYRLMSVDGKLSPDQQRQVFSLLKLVSRSDEISERMRQVAESPDTVLAIRDDRVVGLYHYNRDRDGVGAIAVDAAYRGMGIVDMLLEDLAERFGEGGDLAQFKRALGIRSDVEVVWFDGQGGRRAYRVGP